jgi:hypothetical protein
MAASGDNTKGSTAERLNAISDSFKQCRETAEKNARDNKARWDALAAAEQDRLTKEWMQSDKKSNKPDAKKAKDSLNAQMPSGSLWGLAKDATSLAWTSMTQDKVEEGFKHNLDHQMKDPALSNEQKIDMLLSQLGSIQNELSILEAKRQAREEKDLSRLEEKTFNSKANPSGLNVALKSQSGFGNQPGPGSAEVKEKLKEALKRKPEGKSEGKSEVDKRPPKSSFSP